LVVVTFAENIFSTRNLNVGVWKRANITGW
jgi:hypothetical protein